MKHELPTGWEKLLNHPFDGGAYAKTLERAQTLCETSVVLPARENWFAAFEKTPPERVRVVLLGQDPYHEPGQAHGLAFSVQRGTKLPPSLVNIYKELESDLGITPAKCGDLTPWAQQGVLLLNTVLTVRQGSANSHQKLGWQAFTDNVIAHLALLPQPIAFVLWGAQAQKKAAIAADSTFVRLVLQAPHPSPLSSYRGFFGSRPFSKINAFLQANGQPPICWALE